jgi:hypothetical protein
MEFYREVGVATTGQDCPAALAWVIQMVADNIATGKADALAARRAAVHWDAASEPMQIAIATKLGWCFDAPTGARLSERWPVPPAIAEDYKVAAEFISQALC